MASFIACISIWRRESLGALCFMFYMSHLLAPLLFLFVCKGGRWELIVETKGAPLPVQFNINLKWTRSSQNHPPSSLHSLWTWLIIVIFVCAWFPSFEYVWSSPCFKGHVFCVSCFVCLISLLHFCSCLFTRTKSKSLLLKQKEHHCLLSSMLTSNG